MNSHRFFVYVMFFEGQGIPINSVAKLFCACFPWESHNSRALCCKMGYRTDSTKYQRDIASFWDPEDAYPPNLGGEPEGMPLNLGGEIIPPRIFGRYASSGEC